MFLKPSNKVIPDPTFPEAEKIVLVTKVLVVGSNAKPVFPELLIEVLKLGSKAPIASEFAISAVS